VWWGVLVVCLVGDGDGSEQAGDVLDRSTDFSVLNGSMGRSGACFQGLELCEMRK
jgi:hypothetical protein